MTASSKPGWNLPYAVLWPSVSQQRARGCWFPPVPGELPLAWHTGSRALLWNEGKTRECFCICRILLHLSSTYHSLSSQIISFVLLPFGLVIQIYDSNFLKYLCVHTYICIFCCIYAKSNSEDQFQFNSRAYICLENYIHPWAMPKLQSQECICSDSDISLVTDAIENQVSLFCSPGTALPQGHPRRHQ